MPFCQQSLSCLSLCASAREEKPQHAALGRKLTLETSLDFDLSFKQTGKPHTDFDARFFHAEGPLPLAPMDVEGISVAEFGLSSDEEIEPATCVRPLPRAKVKGKTKRTRYFNSYVRKELKRRAAFVARFWRDGAQSFPLVFRRVGTEAGSPKKFLVILDLANKFIVD